MKPVALKSTPLLLSILLVASPLALRAQIAPALPAIPAAQGVMGTSVDADQDWETLQSLNKAAEVALGDGNTKGRSRADFAAQGKSAADRAKKFYERHPDHPKAAEARKLEVFSLILSVENGDAGSAGRLDGLVDRLRKDSSESVALRAQVAAAYDFTTGVRSVHGNAEKIAAVERVARGLVKEFPGQPQGYEALLAVCQASEAEGAKVLAVELAGSGAPDEIKLAAALVLQRLALVGRPLAEALGREGSELAAALPPGKPAIIYSWATWAPATLEFGRMIQARRFAALGICLDADVVTARQAAQGGGLGGQMYFDARGTEGLLATRLGFSGAGHVYLVDAAGLIRDVRGGDDLETKLKALGFSTPALVVPSLPELLRR